MHQPLSYAGLERERTRLQMFKSCPGLDYFTKRSLQQVFFREKKAFKLYQK